MPGRAGRPRSGTAARISNGNKIQLPATTGSSPPTQTGREVGGDRWTGMSTLLGSRIPAGPPPDRGRSARFSTPAIHARAGGTPAVRHSCPYLQRQQNPITGDDGIFPANADGERGGGRQVDRNVHPPWFQDPRRTTAGPRAFRPLLYPCHSCQGGRDARGPAQLPVSPTATKSNYRRRRDLPRQRRRGERWGETGGQECPPSLVPGSPPDHRRTAGVPPASLPLLRRHPVTRKDQSPDEALSALINASDASTA